VWWLQLPVLREALARDDLDRAKRTYPRTRIGTSRSTVRAFIQTVHHFLDATLRNQATPAHHVVVFDEAHRAWNSRQLAGFMKRKKKPPGFTQTEPELLIGAMSGIPIGPWWCVSWRLGVAKRSTPAKHRHHRLARRRPQQIHGLGCVHFTAADRLGVCGERSYLGAQAIAERNFTGTYFHARPCYVAQRREHLEWHLFRGRTLSLGHVDAVLPRGKPFPLCQGPAQWRGEIRP